MTKSLRKKQATGLSKFWLSDLLIGKSWTMWRKIRTAAPLQAPEESLSRQLQETCKHQCWGGSPAQLLARSLLSTWAFSPCLKVFREWKGSMFCGCKETRRNGLHLLDTFSPGHLKVLAKPHLVKLTWKEIRQVLYSSRDNKEQRGWRRNAGHTQEWQEGRSATPAPGLGAHGPALCGLNYKVGENAFGSLPAEVPWVSLGDVLFAAQKQEG